VSFLLRDGTILEGDPDDLATICLEITTPKDNVDRYAEGNITISDIGNAGIDSMSTRYNDTVQKALLYYYYNHIRRSPFGLNFT
jgi:hypothetical protein